MLRLHLSTIIVIAIFVFSTSLVHVTAQQGEHRIFKRNFRNEPLEIIEIKKGNQLLQFNKTISGDDDWLKGAQVLVKNKSSLAINSLIIQIEIIDPENQSLASVPFVVAGNNTQRHGVTSPLSFKPGEFLRLSFPDKFHDKLKQFGARFGSPRLDRVMLRIDTVVFENDMLWHAGFMHRRNPNDQNKWDAIRDDLPISEQRRVENLRNATLGQYESPFFLPSSQLDLA